MDLQSLENWNLYFAITDIRNIDNLRTYQCLNALNRNIAIQEQWYKQQTDDLGTSL